MGLDQDLVKYMEELQMEIPQWTEQSEEYIIKLRLIADSIDDYHTEATKANIAGSVTGAVGGILSIAGLIASPFTLGGSLVLAGVGTAASVVGGATNIAANVSDNKYQKRNQKRVKEIIQQYLKQHQSRVNKLELLNKTIESIIKNATKNVQSVALFHVSLGTMKSLSCISTVTSAVTKKALKVFKCVSGVFAGLTVAWDIYSVFKDSEELKAKETEISQMIREVAKYMEEEKDNFKKIALNLKDNTDLQKFLKQCGRQ
ncbi:apolipoprotein L6-like [Hemitrygon akajei]|uniref:apolipoprotein L6-like n=1 Tax=Hemitrygon akajei TaxID=2704970 RepID=UPI003BFA0088